MYKKVGNHLLQRRHSDEYAAVHVASALYAAGEGKRVLELAEEDIGSSVVHDALLRREAQLQRLRIALRFSNEQKDLVDAIRAVLRGAEALRTEAVIHNLVVTNPDLSAAFMRESAVKLVLLDSSAVEHHGPLLFNLLLEDANENNKVMFREDYRQLSAWLRKRSDALSREKAEHPNSYRQSWEIGTQNISAEIEGVLRLYGGQAAVDQLARWRPKTLRLSVARTVIPRLLTAGHPELVEDCLKCGFIREPWNLFLLVPLALAGRPVQLNRLESALGKTLRHGLIDLQRLSERAPSEDLSYWLDTILTACEIVVARRGDRQIATLVAARFASEDLRRVDQLSSFEAALLDLMIRAHALTENLAGRTANLNSFLVEASDEAQPDHNDSGQESQRRKKERRTELEDVVGPLLSVYNSRAQLLVGSAIVGHAGSLLSKSASNFHDQDYRFSRRMGSRSLLTLAALAVSRLIVIPGTDTEAILSGSLALLTDRSGTGYDENLKVLSALALHPKLRERVLPFLLERAKQVASTSARASEKIDSMLAITRVVEPISRSEAVPLFSQAHSMAGEIDQDAIFQMRALAALGLRGASGLDSNLRRRVATDLHAVLTDTATRLSMGGDFPWEGMVEALSSLDLSVGLAAVARWQDSGTASFESTVPGLINASLSVGAISAKQAIALLTLIERADESLLQSILKSLKGEPIQDLPPLIEDLAKDELLRFGLGRRPDICKTVEDLNLPEDNRGPWCKHLDAACKLTASLELSPVQPKVAEHPSDESRPLPAFDESRRYVTSAEISQTVKEAKEAARADGLYLSLERVFEYIRNRVAISDRIAHLTALSEVNLDRADERDRASAMLGALKLWKSPAVEGWSAIQLPGFIVARLPTLALSMEYLSQNPVESLIDLLPPQTSPYVFSRESPPTWMSYVDHKSTRLPVLSRSAYLRKSLLESSLSIYKSSRADCRRTAIVCYSPTCLPTHRPQWRGFCGHFYRTAMFEFGGAPRTRSGVSRVSVIAVSWLVS